MYQRTIAEKVTCTGLGLHTGLPVQLTLRPARVGTGVVFERRSGGQVFEIPARAGNVSSTSHATTLSNGIVSISTVEHLLAALHGLGVDNVRVEVDGPEVPVMDGSADSFVYLIESAGLFVQPAHRSVLRILRPIEVRDGEKCARIEPNDVLRITYAVDFEHPAIGRQVLDLPDVDETCFRRELARARTFGFLHEVGALRQAGLAQGGSLDNTLVLDEKRVVNSSGLRWPDEFVRHKALDLLGDLSLLGAPLRGHVHVERGGHTLHHRLVKQVLASASTPSTVVELHPLTAPPDAHAAAG